MFYFITEGPRLHLGVRMTSHIDPEIDLWRYLVKIISDKTKQTGFCHWVDLNTMKCMETPTNLPVVKDQALSIFGLFGNECFLSIEKNNFTEIRRSDLITSLCLSFPIVRTSSDSRSRPVPICSLTDTKHGYDRCQTQPNLKICHQWQGGILSSREKWCFDWWTDQGTGDYQYRLWQYSLHLKLSVWQQQIRLLSRDWLSFSV